MAKSGLAFSALPKGCVWAPIHRVDDSTPISICLVARMEGSPESPFVLLRDLPGVRIYLGAVCDALGHAHEWVEIQVQMADTKQLEFSGSDELLTNAFFDARWQKDGMVLKSQMPDSVIGTRMETRNPAPILIKRADGTGPFAPVEAMPWRICKDDALLKSQGLPPYSTSSFRYLFQPELKDAQTFVAATVDAPTNAKVEGLEQFKAAPNVCAVFNPGGGFVRIVRYSPMELESFLQILEGKVWNEANSETTVLSSRSVYGALRDWSANPGGLPFLLHGKTGGVEHLNEIFLLKLSLLYGLLKNVRAYVGIHQLPLFNLTPASFRVYLEQTGDLFPGLWSAQSQLVKPGQAYPLQIQSSGQRYFVRAGRIEPTPFFPGSVGAHAFGIASAQIRDVQAGPDGVVLEGTLVAEDFLVADPHDLLWFRLPFGEERIEFYGHLHKSEGGGPREARFRTLPALLSEDVVAKIKASAGVRFPKSPYEIRPLLSSPCDLFSVGVIGVRILLAHNAKNLAVLLDEVLSLARRVNDVSADQDARVSELQKLIQNEPPLYELLNPGALVESGYTSKQAWSAVHGPAWLETISLLLRCFPETGPHAFCRGLGDVSAAALETVFDPALQALEVLVLRLRALFTPAFAANEEIASVIRELISKE